jgi:hypothetical protein
MRRNTIPQVVWRLVTIMTVMIGALAIRPQNARADQLPSIVYTQNVCTAIWSQPSTTSTYMADVIGGTGLHITGISNDGAWYHVLFLGLMPAWVTVSSVISTQSAAKQVNGDCYYPNGPQIQQNSLANTPGPFNISATGTITQPTDLRSSQSASAPITARLSSGMRVSVSQWAGDSHGDIWYLAQVGGIQGWIWAYALQLDGPDPATRQVNGKPIWASIAGKGMWFTNYFSRHTDPQTLVDAAKAAGITHIYPEVAISRNGAFFGQESLDKLLPVAHAAGIKVIAWVYPYLDNVADEITMTQAVFNYRTPGGDKADGIAADIEERMDAPAVYAYGQVLRQIVGPDYLLVATTYNPHAKINYPFPEIAASFNVIAPQDYWHSSKSTTYSPSDAATLLMGSIYTIRSETGGKQIPIEELGQMYDMFTGDGSPGSTEPTGEEIEFNLRAAKALGCIGASYFEWQTASPGQLDAFNRFKW